MDLKNTKIKNWKSMKQPKKSNLLELLYKMITEYENSTIKIFIDDVYFNCNINVLQCYSKYFKDKTLVRTVRLPVEHVTQIAFVMVYDWMITADPKVQRSGILQLFNAAEYLQIPELIAQCWVCFDDESCLSEDAAFIIFLEARELGMKTFQHLFLNRISKYFLSLVATEEFLDFDLENLCILFQSNLIGVNSENDVFMAAVHWLNHDWDTRSKHLVEVMKCVRFGLMTSCELVTLSKKIDRNEYKETNRVTENHEVQDMITNGLRFVTVKSWKSQKPEEFLKLLEKLDCTEPIDRQWIYDEALASLQYQHKLPITYHLFLEYLEMFKGLGADRWKSLESSKIRMSDI